LKAPLVPDFPNTHSGDFTYVNSACCSQCCASVTISPAPFGRLLRLALKYLLSLCT